MAVAVAAARHEQGPMQGVARSAAAPGAQEAVTRSQRVAHARCAPDPLEDEARRPLAVDAPQTQHRPQLEHTRGGKEGDEDEQAAAEGGGRVGRVRSA
eukprot:5425954-Prymnesium_polylepis.2